MRAGLRMTLVAVLAALACTAAYWPGLGGPFYFDSIERIALNDALTANRLDTATLIRAAYAGEQAYPERALSNISFALNHWLSGGRFVPAAFKLTNVVIHLLNGWLVLWLLARALVGAPWRWVANETAAFWLAALAAVVWLLHPIQLTSVLYAVQRMTSLSGTFVLLGLVLFTLGRARLETRPRAAFAIMLSGLALGAGLGFFAKQNALLTPLFALLIEWFFFERWSLSRATRRALVGFYALTVALPLLAACAVLLVNPELVLDGYRARSFGAIERLLTQSRVLVRYMVLMLLPMPGALSLYHDDVAVSEGLLSPPTTAACLLLWGVLVAIVMLGWRRRWPWSFGIAWFLIGHLLESSVLPLEMMHEHRNYVPSLGLFVAAAWTLKRASARIPVAVTATAAALLLAVLTALTATRAVEWQQPDRLMHHLAHHHPASARALIGTAAASPKLDREQRIALLTRAALLGEDQIDPLIRLGQAIAKGPPEVDEMIAEAVAVTTGGVPVTARNALIVALGASVQKRLTHHAVTTSSVVSLVSVTDCAIAKRPECAAFQPQLRQWIETVLAHRRTTDINLSALQLTLAKLHAAAGDTDAALAAAAGVSRWTPENLRYRLLEVELHARLGRVDSAAERLAAVEKDFPVRTRGDPRVARLQSALLPYRKQ